MPTCTGTCHVHVLRLFPLHCSELSFRKGDTVYLLHQIDRNWYEGERHGVRGIFPVNYVEVTSSLRVTTVL